MVQCGCGSKTRFGSTYPCFFAFLVKICIPKRVAKNEWQEFWHKISAFHQFLTSLGKTKNTRQ